MATRYYFENWEVSAPSRPPLEPLPKVGSVWMKPAAKLFGWETKIKVVGTCDGRTGFPWYVVDKDLRRHAKIFVEYVSRKRKNRTRLMITLEDLLYNYRKVR